MATRLSAVVFGLGSAISKEDSDITGSRLPTCRQVLRCMMYHIEEGSHENRTKWESAKLVLNHVSVFYEKANIPMISEKKACERIIKLLNENAKIRAIPVSRRGTEASLKKVQEMEEKLATTFQLWPVNVEMIIKNPEDRRFLESMKGDRSATFGPLDRVLANKIKRRQEKEKAEDDRRKRVHKEMASANVVVVAVSTMEANSPNSVSDSQSDVESVDVAPNDTEYDPPIAGPSTSSGGTRSHHRTARTGTKAFIPHDILKRPSLVSLATRLKMTPAQQAIYTKAVIVEAGGDIKQVSTSYSTADRTRREVGKQIDSSLRENWVAPMLATLHWDSKLMSSLSNQNVNEERLTVVVGNQRDLKLLGVPSYQPGSDRKSGDIIAELTVDLLESWGCADSIVNMTFDTTASNTGHITAACVTIQQKLGRALLWSPCRHHIGEVILTHVFDGLKIEVSKSPDVNVFTRFRKNFTYLSRGSDEMLRRLDHTAFSEEAQTIIQDLKDTALKLAKNELTLHRDDYQEFIELCVAFLDGHETAFQAIDIKRPGALHKARWMAKLLYCIKLSLLEDQIHKLPPGTVTTRQQVSKIRDFATFATLIYSHWWMTCSTVSDAPLNDLNLYQNLILYEKINPEISKSAIHAFKLHHWYLTEEMIPLALFSNQVSEELKRSISDRLQTIKPDPEVGLPQNRFGTGFGKPRFPQAINLSSTTTLADLVGTDSWFMFNILQLNSDFLTKDIGEWKESDAYQNSQTNIQALNVVNDCAERGVKLSSDFLSSAKKEEHFQNVLQVVEDDRKERPNLRKPSNKRVTTL